MHVSVVVDKITYVFVAFIFFRILKNLPIKSFDQNILYEQD